MDIHLSGLFLDLAMYITLAHDLRISQLQFSNYKGLLAEPCNMLSSRCKPALHGGRASNTPTQSFTSSNGCRKTTIPFTGSQNRRHQQPQECT